jgi:Sulfatase
MYDPADCPLPVPISDDRHPLHDRFLASPAAAAPADGARVQRIRARYYGMVSEVDAQLGRIWQRLREQGEWDNTLIVVTSDHGEYLGDYGLIGKLGWFDVGYHVLGIIRDPTRPAGHGVVVEEFTENVDIFPTICEAIGEPVPLQCDGVALTTFLDGEIPATWRDAAHYEWDWRDQYIGETRDVTDRSDRRLERRNLAVHRSRDRAYVQFGDGSWRCYTWPPTRRGTRRSPRTPMVPPSCSATPRQCSCGEQRTPTANSPACSCEKEASAAGPTRSIRCQTPDDSGNSGSPSLSADVAAEADSDDSRSGSANPPPVAIPGPPLIASAVSQMAPDQPP